MFRKPWATMAMDGTTTRSLFLKEQCSNCPVGVNGTCVCAKDLPQFLKMAFEMHKKEVLQEKKLYRRFTEDFLNSNYFIDCPFAVCKNQHKKNFCILQDLLENRWDIVEIFFHKKVFNEEDCREAITMYNTTSAPVVRRYNDNAPPPTEDTNTRPFESYFDNNQLSLIAQLANEVHLFTETVSVDDIRQLFGCTLQRPLQATNNRLLAYFFDQLSESGLVCFKWQSVLVKCRQVHSSTSGTPFTASKLSSATNKAKGTNRSVYQHIRKAVQKIAENDNR